MAVQGVHARFYAHTLAAAQRLALSSRSLTARHDTLPGGAA
jgi:hypothetical protein